MSQQLLRTVAFGLLVWSTGLAPNPLITSISELAKDEKTSRYISSFLLFPLENRMNFKIPSLLTDDNLNVITKDEGTPDPDVWAIGDAAVMQDQRLPATAQGQPSRSIVSYETLTDSQTAVANQKAKYIVKKLNKIVKGRNSTKPFEFHNQGSLAYVGDWFVAMQVPR